MGKAIKYDRYKIGDRVYVDFKPYFEPGVLYTVSYVVSLPDGIDQYGFKDSHYVAKAHRIVGGWKKYL